MRETRKICVSIPYAEYIAIFTFLQLMCVGVGEENAKNMHTIGVCGRFFMKKVLHHISLAKISVDASERNT